jgi:hypothetical protein
MTTSIRAFFHRLRSAIFRPDSTAACLKTLVADSELLKKALRDTLTLVGVVEERSRSLESAQLDTLTLVGVVEERSRSIESAQLDTLTLVGVVEERSRSIESAQLDTLTLVGVVEERSRSLESAQLDTLTLVGVVEERSRSIESAQLDTLTLVGVVEERSRSLESAQLDTLTLVGVVEERSRSLKSAQLDTLTLVGVVEERSRSLEYETGQVGALLQAQGLELARLGSNLKNMEERWNEGFSAGQLQMLNPRLSRNFLPNDAAVMQKNLMVMWRAGSAKTLTHRDLMDSSFRVFSQNDEDGVLLRIFSHIGQTNQYVIEIGSNCSGSDVGIPENLSTNLIVNHGWHGAVFEIDQVECARIRHFFARDYATKHFHFRTSGQSGYFSPLITQGAINPENIDQVLLDGHNEPEPDLMCIDIDGGDYAAIRSMSAVRPRVLVVEFEKRFRDRYSVVQFDSASWNKTWEQSGAASLPAWEKLLTSKGYALCAIGSCGFNAFFIRSDIATGKFLPVTSGAAFDAHPIYAKLPEDFWCLPDETWQPV